VDFTSRTTLTLISKTLGTSTARFREVHVSEVAFDAIAMAGERVTYDLAQIDQVETDVPSMGKTLGLMFGIAGGVVVVMSVVFVVLITSLSHPPQPL
jgi:hypothetical protein